MNDSFITALNTQKSTTNWIDVIAHNMTNVYTPGFREQQVISKPSWEVLLPMTMTKRLVRVNLLRVLLPKTYILKVRAFSL